MNDPFSPDRLAEIHEHDAAFDLTKPHPFPTRVYAHRRELLAEVDRLTAELARLEDLGIERHAEMLVDEVRLRSLEIRNGGFKMEMEEARDLAAIYVACARTMLGDAENYSETKISFDVKIAESPETYVLTVQRTESGKLTPHEARQQAETERDRLRTELDDTRQQLDEAIDLDRSALKHQELRDDRHRAVKAWHDEHKRAEAAEAECDRARQMLRYCYKRWPAPIFWQAAAQIDDPFTALPDWLTDDPQPDPGPTRHGHDSDDQPAGAPDA